MTLRSRLTLAFFAIAVIPLSAVTLFSYYSSERALRRAAEQQAASMAAELGRRMEWVTTDLERRMDRVWPMPEEQVAADEAPGQAGGGSAGGPRPPARAGAPPAPAAPQPPDMAGHIAVVLGDAAPMIESLEIMPGRAAMPGRPGAPGPAPAPGHPAPLSAPRSVPPAPPVPGAGAAGDAPQTARVPPESQQAAARGARAGEMVSVEMSRVIEKAMQASQASGATAQFDVGAWSKTMQERIGQAATSGCQR